MSKPGGRRKGRRCRQNRWPAGRRGSVRTAEGAALRAADSPRRPSVAGAAAALFLRRAPEQEDTTQCQQGDQQEVHPLQTFKGAAAQQVGEQATGQQAASRPPSCRSSWAPGA